jgi:hypothetical protein
MRDSRVSEKKGMIRQIEAIVYIIELLGIKKKNG